jgi:hypothetical protein
MIMQPIAQILGILTNSAYELIQVNDEENTDEKENQKDDNKDEEIKFPLLSFCNDYKSYGNDCSFLISDHSLYGSFYLEVLIPPPDMI